MTVGGCVVAFWLALATAPPGLLVALYDPPLSDFTVTAPLLCTEPFWCAQSTGPASAGRASTAARPAAAHVDALRPDWRGHLQQRLAAHDQVIDPYWHVAVWLPAGAWPATPAGLLSFMKPTA